MKISYVPVFNDWASSPHIHILTYAEEGFAPLNFHAKKFRVEQAILVKFADEVNARDETGSLHPVASISAVPRRLIRDHRGFEELPKFIHEFIQVNGHRFLARKVIFDFVTNHLSTFVLTTLETTLLALPDSSVDEFVIVR